MKYNIFTISNNGLRSNPELVHGCDYMQYRANFGNVILVNMVIHHQNYHEFIIGGSPGELSEELVT